jgi:multiple sugar transport system permease protein
MSAVSPPVSAAPEARRLDQRRFDGRSLFLLAPAIILLLAMFVGPVLYAFYIGFTNLQLIGPHALSYSFTGLANVRTLLSDAVFRSSLWTTLIFVVGSGVVGATTAGMVLAILMLRSKAIVRVPVGLIVFVAFILPPIDIAIIWIAMTTSGGTIAALIHDRTADLLQSTAMLDVSLANAWSLAGFSMIVFMAAMRHVSSEVIEAAAMDGAGAVRRYFSIILPLLWPTVMVMVLFNTLLSLGNFSIVYIMTAGGPNNATNILPVYSYLQGFNFQNLSYGALIGDAMVIIAGTLAAIYVKVSRVRV